MRGRDVKITVDNLPSAEGDRSLLKQVFLNLLTNALKFTRQQDHAEIHIGCTHGDGEKHAVFFVRDNGVGFDETFAETIFGPFQRLAQVHQVEGSGIGLALVRRIIERHGGSIWAESSPGRGATFFFTLDGTAARVSG